MSLNCDAQKGNILQYLTSINCGIKHILLQQLTCINCDAKKSSKILRTLTSINWGTPKITPRTYEYKRWCKTKITKHTPYPRESKLGHPKKNILHTLNSLNWGTKKYIYTPYTQESKLGHQKKILRTLMSINWGTRKTFTPMTYEYKLWCRKESIKNTPHPHECKLRHTLFTPTNYEYKLWCKKKHQTYSTPSWA